MYAKVSKKGQVTIPKSVRDILNIGKNGAVLFVVENHEVKLKGVPISEAELLAGSLSEYAPHIPLNRLKEMVWEAVVRETMNK